MDGSPERGWGPCRCCRRSLPQYSPLTFHFLVVNSTCSDFNHGSALHIAASNLCLGAAKCLLEHGANPALRVLCHPLSPPSGRPLPFTLNIQNHSQHPRNVHYGPGHFSL